MIGSIRHYCTTDLNDHDLACKLEDISPIDPEGALFWV